MAELKIQVRADYSEVVNLQKKIAELKERIARYNPVITPAVELGKMQRELRQAENKFNDLSARLRLIDNASRKAGQGMSVFGDNVAKVGDAAEKTDGTLKQIGEGVGDIVKRYTAVSLAMGGIYAAINQLKGSLSTIMSFKTENASLQAILAATDEQMKGFKKTAEELGRSTVFTASQVTSLQIALAKLGFTEGEIHAMEKDVLHFAQATGASLDEAAETTGAALRMFNVQADQYEEKAREYTNAMASATMRSALDFRMIRDNLATFGPMAASMGLQIEDVLALFGKLKDNGVEASTAMTSLRNIFTKVAQGKIEGMGKVDSLDDFVAGLEKLKGLDSGKGMKMIGPRGGTQFITLINQAEQILALRDNIKEGMQQDTTGGMADKMVNNLSGELKMLQSAWEGFVLTFQESDGVFKDIVHGATDMITNLREMIAGEGDWSRETMDNIATTVKVLIGGIAAIKSVSIAKEGVNILKSKAEEAKDVVQAEVLRRQREELAKKTGVTNAATAAEGRRTAALRESIAMMQQEIAQQRQAAIAMIEATARSNDASVRKVRNARLEVETEQAKIIAIREEMQANIQAAAVAQTASERKIKLAVAEKNARMELAAIKRKEALEEKLRDAEDSLLQKNGQGQLTGLREMETQMGRTAGKAQLLQGVLGALGIPTDPISLVTMAVMALGAAVYYLYTRTTQLEDMMKSAGEAVANVDSDISKQLATLKANVATLSTVSTSTQLYGEKLTEVKAEMAKYNVHLNTTIDKQGNEIVSTEELKKKHEELAAAIKAEGEERRIYEATKAINDASAGKEKEYRKTLQDKIDDDSGLKSSTLASFVTDDALVKAAQAIEYQKALNRLRKEGKTGTEEYRDTQQKYVAAQKAWGDEVNSVTAKVRAYGRVLGLSDEETRKMVKAVQVYMAKMGAMRFTTYAATSAIADMSKHSAAMGVGLDKTAEKAMIAKKSISELKDQLAEIANKFKTIGIDIEINRKTAIPKWMDEQVKIKGSQWAKEMSSYYAKALAHAQKNGQGFVKDPFGNLISVQEAMNRSYEYAEAAAKNERKVTASSGEKKEETTTYDGKAAAKKLKQQETARQKAEKEKEKAENARKNAEEKLRSLETENTDKEISQEDESVEKRTKAVENNYKKSQNRIIKAAEEFAKLNKDAKEKTATEKLVVDDRTIEGLTLKQEEELNKSIVLAEQEKAKSLDEIRKQELKKQQEYLRDYGDYQQQIDAIKALAEGEKNNLAPDDDYGKMRIDKDAEKSLTDLRQKHEKDTVLMPLDIEGTFRTLDKYTTDYLIRLQDQLETALTKVTGENADLIKKKIQEIQRLQNERQHSGEGGMFGSKGFFGGSSWGKAYQTIQKQKGLEAQAFKDQKDLSDYRTKLADQYDELGKMDPSQITADNKKIQSVLSAEDLKGLQAAEGTAGASQAMAGAGQGAAAAAVTDAIIHGVNQNIQSFREAGEILWGKDSDMAKSINQFADSSQYATDAYESLKSGDLVGTAVNLGHAINSLGESFGIWSNSNRAEVEKANEKLANAMSVNTEALNRLTDKMSEGTAVDKANSYEQAVGTMQTNEKASLQTMLNNAGLYDGGHSLNSDFYDMYEDSDLRKRLKSWFGKDIGGLSEILSLDPKEVNKLYNTAGGRQLMTDITQMMTDAGDEGNYGSQIVQDWLDHLSAYSEEAYDELYNKFRENVTKVSFDSFKDEFKSTLMDMDADTTTFADNFTKKLTQSFLDAQIEKLYNDRIQSVYTAWSDALTNDNQLSSEELARLKSQYSSLTADMMKTRDEIAAITGYDDISSREANGTINSAKSMSEDTANELVGRVTAVQLGVENIRTTQTTMIANLQASVDAAREAVTLRASEQTNALEGIRGILADSYIELRGINENTSAVVEPIRSMASDISTMKTKIKNL